MKRIEFQMIKNNMIEDVVLIVPNSISEWLIKFYLRYNRNGNKLDQKTKRILDKYKNEEWILPDNTKFITKDLKKKNAKNCGCVFCECTCPECGEWDGVEVVFMPRFEMKNTEKNILKFSYLLGKNSCTLYCSHCDKEFDYKPAIAYAITDIVGFDDFRIGQVLTNDEMIVVKC